MTMTYAEQLIAAYHKWQNKFAQGQCSKAQWNAVMAELLPELADRNITP